MEVFIPYRPQARAREIVKRANGIIEGYLSQGFKLTLPSFSTSLLRAAEFT
jgi:hypothetical protein